MKGYINTMRISAIMLSLGVLFPMANAAAGETTGTQEGKIVNRHSFDEYIRLFNSKDPACFEKYFSSDVRMQNGKLVLKGIPAVKAHYGQIWPIMKEEVKFNNFAFDGKTLAVDMHTHFTVMADAPHSPFGAVKKGENFDYYGVVMYRVNDAGKFNDIKVAYLDFTRTQDGKTVSLGLPH